MRSSVIEPPKSLGHGSSVLGVVGNETGTVERAGNAIVVGDDTKYMFVASLYTRGKSCLASQNCIGLLDLAYG
jgi:hypothetical protein